MHRSIVNCMQVYPSGSERAGLCQNPTLIPLWVDLIDKMLKRVCFVLECEDLIDNGGIPRPVTGPFRFWKSLMISSVSALKETIEERKSFSSWNHLWTIPRWTFFVSYDLILLRYSFIVRTLMIALRLACYSHFEGLWQLCEILHIVEPRTIYGPVADRGVFFFVFALDASGFPSTLSKMGLFIHLQFIDVTEGWFIVFEGRISVWEPEIQLKYIYWLNDCSLEWPREGRKVNLWRLQWMHFKFSTVLGRKWLMIW